MAKKMMSVAAQKMAKARKAKAAREAKKGTTGNAALDRANAVAKKGPKATAKKIAGTVDQAAAKAVQKAKPQFFGRPKVKKPVDQEKVKAERNALHQRMMRVPWYAEHRTESIELWVARRAAIAAKDTAKVEQINAKLERVNKKRDKARAEWKAAGSIIPDEPIAKPEKQTKKAAKKPAAKKAKKVKKVKKQPQEPAEPAGDVTTTENPTGTVEVGGETATE